jgi:PAS domain S-box-containing protein
VRNAFIPPQEVASPLRLRTIRVFLALGIGWSLLALSICLNSPILESPLERGSAAAVPAAMAVILAWGFWRFGQLDYARAVSTSCWAALACVGIVAAASGRGIHSHAIGLVGLILCSHGITLGLRHTLPMAVVAVLVEGALFGAERAGLLPGVTPQTEASDELVLLAHAMNLTSGISVGLMGWTGLEILRRRGRREDLRMGAMLRVAADAYWEQDARGQFTHWSEQAGAAPLAALPGLIGRQLEAVDSWFVEPEALERFKQQFQQGQVIHGLPIEVRLPGHGTRFLRLSGEPRFGENRELAGYWGIAQDVTQEQATVRALAASEAEQRRSQALLTQLFATGSDAIAVVDIASGTYTLVNNSFSRVSGWQASEVEGRGVGDIPIWRDPSDLMRLLRGALRDGDGADLPALMKTRSGETRMMQLSPSRFEMEGRDYLVVNARDITEVQRVRLEHDAMLRHAPLGVVFTRHWHILHSNMAFEAMFGWPPGSSKGRHVSSVWATQQEYELVNEKATAKLTLGEAVDFETRTLRADGSFFWCRMAGRVIDPSDPARGGVIWIAEDVTEKRRFDEALALSRDAAEAANRAKSAFLANTSHELRTPLNAMVGLAQLAQAHELDEGKRHRYLAQIVESGKVLTGIISDVLDLAKVEAGKLRLEIRPFSLKAALEGLQEAYAPLAENKGLTMTLNMAADLPPTVSGDAMRLRQILANLLANAIKFTERGCVSLMACPLEKAIRFEVTDTGPGIEQEALAALFQPFSQADVSTTRRFGGTGLGLAICQELVTLMGGTLGVRSQPGQGSVFWVEIPLLPPPPHADDLQALPPDTPDHRPGPNDVLAQRLRGKRVMVVEDNEVNMLITSACLEHWGAHVVKATDGRSALALLQADVSPHAPSPQPPVDLVLMDLQMPDMSGYEAAQAIHALPSLAQLPVIALTAAALVEERQRAFDAGMVAFLSKPIQAEALEAALSLALGLHDPQTETPAAEAAGAGRPPGQAQPR